MVCVFAKVIWKFANCFNYQKPYISLPLHISTLPDSKPYMSSYPVCHRIPNALLYMPLFKVLANTNFTINVVAFCVFTRERIILSVHSAFYLYCIWPNICYWWWVSRSNSFVSHPYRFHVLLLYFICWQKSCLFRKLFYDNS